MKRKALAVALGALLLAACSGRTAGADARADASEEAAVEVPAFNADSAYSYVARQVAFGPRVPGTAAHRACGDWIVATLSAAGADTVVEQRATVRAFDGTQLPLRNIIGRFNTGASERVLLLAHWDTRPWADEEPDRALHSQPIAGANDGGSGVGVLLELASMLGRQAPTVGVDLLFVDCEDYGTSGDDTSWALGAQHFAKNLPYAPGQTPRYAILLDMVGGMGARFHREPFSDRYARRIVDKVWGAAEAEGLADRFVNRSGSPVMDDHIPLLGAGIPAIDIIEGVNASTGSFPPTWHTLADDLPAIDRTSLEAVGRTVARVIYSEK